MAATALLIGSLFTWLPSPIQPSAAGYVNYRDPVVVRAETEGFLVASQLLQKDSTPGDKRVRAGDVLAVLINPELELELALKANEVATVQETIRLQRAQGNLAQLQSNQAKLVSLQQQLRQLQERLEKLEIRAPVDGNVATNDLRRLNGTFLHAGDPICTLADPQRLEVVAFIGQNDIEHLRSSQGQSVPIVLAGGPTILGIVDRVDPRARKVLPAPVLAACYGGPIAVTLGESAAGEELLEMLDPRFQVHIRVPEKSFGDLQPGQTTSVRIPQRTASLWALLDHWCRRKWNALWSDSRQQGI
jgi:multidrug efflux pump subunit AcrA (membrane-fusion protein)